MKQVKAFLLGLAMLAIAKLEHLMYRQGQIVYALTPTNIGDNPQQPMIAAEAYIPDQLIAGGLKIITLPITVTGAALLTRGTVLGAVTLASATSAAKAGGNTGNGTLVMDATTPVLANAKLGVYTVRNIIAGVNTGTFVVTDPLGNVVGEPIIAAGAGGTIAFANEVKFVITDGATDFIVGDGFDITVAAGSGKYKKSVKTAVDGSQYPVAILADDADASGGDVTSGAYVMGEFNSNALVMDASWTAATLEPILRPIGIFLKSFVSATDPT